jgi:hypothetical protein
METNDTGEACNLSKALRMTRETMLRLIGYPMPPTLQTVAVRRLAQDDGEYGSLKAIEAPEEPGAQDLQGSHPLSNKNASESQ